MSTIILDGKLLSTRSDSICYADLRPIFTEAYFAKIKWIQFLNVTFTRDAYNAIPASIRELHYINKISFHNCFVGKVWLGQQPSIINELISSGINYIEYQNTPIINHLNNWQLCDHEHETLNISDDNFSCYNITFNLHYPFSFINTSILYRNMAGYEKMQHAIYTIILAWRKDTVFSWLPRELILLIAKLLHKSRGTKIWC